MQKEPEAEGLRVVEVESAPSWLLVQEDDQPTFTQVIPLGFSQEFDTARTARIQAGNAEAVRVVVDDRDLGYLNTSGQVVTRAYTV